MFLAFRWRAALAHPSAHHGDAGDDGGLHEGDRQRGRDDPLRQGPPLCAAAVPRAQWRGGGKGKNFWVGTFGLRAQVFQSLTFLWH